MRFLYLIANFLQMLFVKRTFGVRVLVLKDDQILLVKHTYMPCWYFPGGGVNPKESPVQGAIREVQEEAGIIVQGNLEILGIYYNIHQGHDDYITVYVCKDFKEENSIDAHEIVEKKWFSLNDLPHDISLSCLMRIQEYLKQKPLHDRW